MITMVPEDIEEYAVAHTTPLPDHMAEVMRDTYATQELAGMLSGPMEGMLLQFFVWATGARRILEVGTFTGFSAQMMAAALPADGELITCDLDPEMGKIAQRNFDNGPHASKIELRIGPGLETMKSLKPPFDLVFIDADKENYPNYYEEAMRLLSPKGIIAIDNVLWGGKVLDPKESSDKAIAALNERVKNDDRVVHVMVTVRDGIMLIRKK